MTNDQLLAISYVEEILNVWLIDNTEDVFEEQPEIDAARGVLIDLIEAAENKLPFHFNKDDYE